MRSFVRGASIRSHQNLDRLPSGEPEWEDHALHVCCRIGLHRLKVYGPILEVTQPPVTPGVEADERLRLDHAFPGGFVGVDDYYLLLVERWQLTTRPAPGGLHDDLLAGYPGPALHRPYRIPCRRDRCACQNVVKRGEQQIVPGDIDPSVELPSFVFAVHETLDETPALIKEV